MSVARHATDPMDDDPAVGEITVSESAEHSVASVSQENLTISLESTPLLEPEFALRSFLSPFIPDADLEQARKWTDRRKSFLLAMCITATLVLLANIAATVFCVVYYDTPIIYRGNCGVAHSIDTGLHGVINVLSTLLLSASNLSMQLLAAPTRTEIDRAHMKKVWLDIGVPSIRNMRYIAKRRRALWILLGFSSLPLHFM